MRLRNQKSILNVLALLTLITFLTSCSAAVKQLEIFKVEEPRQPLNLEKPMPAQLNEIKWIIINSENAEEVFAKLKKAETDAVIFGLTDEGYEALSINFAQIRAYMIQQDKIIDAYKKYYETEDTKKDK